MKKLTIPKRSHLLDRLAKANEKRQRNAVVYETGHVDEKVWENFQLTKGLKREFVALCDKHSINKSEFLRKCVIALIKSKGNAARVLIALSQNDTGTKLSSGVENNIQGETTNS